jgi:mannose-6-phosphate isomerase-like protein (cupin superfamily)
LAGFWVQEFIWSSGVIASSSNFNGISQKEDMRRRTFLKTAAAIIPCAGLHDVISEYAHAEAQVPATADSPHVVGAGEDRFRQPVAMGFSTMLFKVGTKETAGGLFIIEHKNLLNAGPALHLHVAQEEWFYVVEGRVAFQIGEQRFELGPGESVLAPRRVPHAFAGTGPTPAHMLIAFSPAGKMEACFRDDSSPHTLAERVAWFRRYDMEYVGPSPFKKS